MRFKADINYLPERANGIVEIVAGNFTVELGRPFLARFWCNLIQSQRPKLRPGFLNFLQTRLPVFLATGFDAGVVFKLLLELLNCLAEFRRGNLVPVFPMLLEKIIQFQLCG